MGELSRNRSLDCEVFDIMDENSHQFNFKVPEVKIESKIIYQKYIEEYAILSPAVETVINYTRYVQNEIGLF